ncbi:DUF2249 domain-containing protein [Ideonella sp.]|uniref:DUF2249 domain-containing protein n=1 Tax=Ideonella sp. TaxID=1929293 RepID=UPI0035AE8991
MTLTTYGTKIDLRDIPPRDHPSLVLNTYRLLKAGQSMELIHDQDPRPLYFQLQEHEPGGFRWNCVEESFSVWRVRVLCPSLA